MHAAPWELLRARACPRPSTPRHGSEQRRRRAPARPPRRNHTGEELVEEVAGAAERAIAGPARYPFLLRARAASPHGRAGARAQAASA